MKLTLAWSLAILGVYTGIAQAGTEQLAMSSQIQYSRVVQGGQDPVNAFVFNQAAFGSDTASYTVYATYPYGTPFSYSGTKAADGGTGFVTLPFNFDSSKVAPGNSIPISVTGTDTATGASITQSGTVTVLAQCRAGADFTGANRPPHLESLGDIPDAVQQ